MTRLSAALLAFLAVAAPALAQPSVADFYTGKTIDFIVGYPPGAGFDIYGRALTRFMGRHIPGNPNFVVKNMPGASSLAGLKNIAITAPKDGTTIGTFNPTLVNASVLEPAQVNFDFSRVAWIGNMSNDTKVCFSWSATGVRTADDIRRRGLIIAGTSQGTGFAHGSIMKAIFGDRVKMVLGYQTNQEVWLALERGEAEGNCTGWGIIPITKPEWVKSDKISILAQFAKKPSPQLPDAPLVYDLGISEELKAAISFITLGDNFTRPVITAPGVPADRVAALREAFMATLRDPEFLAYAQKASLEIAPMDATTLEGLVQELRSTPPAAVELARKLSQ